MKRRAAFLQIEKGWGMWGSGSSKSRGTGVWGWLVFFHCVRSLLFSPPLIWGVGDLDHSVPWTLQLPAPAVLCSPILVKPGMMKMLNKPPVILSFSTCSFRRNWLISESQQGLKHWKYIYLAHFFIVITFYCCLLYFPLVGFSSMRDWNRLLVTCN